MPKALNVTGKPFDRATIQAYVPVWLKKAVAEAAQRDGLDFTSWLIVVLRKATGATAPKGRR